MNPWSLFFSVVLVIWITLGSWIYTCRYMQLCTNLNTHETTSEGHGHETLAEGETPEPPKGFTVKYQDKMVYAMSGWLNYQKGDSLPQEAPKLTGLVDTLQAYLSQNPRHYLSIYGYFVPETEDSLIGWQRAKYFQNLLMGKGVDLKQVKLSTYGKKLETDEQGFWKNGLLMALEDLPSALPEGKEAGTEAIAEEKEAESTGPEAPAFTAEELRLLEQKHLINFPYRVSHVRPSPEDQAFLELIARYMKSKPELKVLLTGHTDNTGDEDKNQQLGLQRANFVADILVGQGISKSRITTRSEGAGKPLMNNDTESNRQKNRRVEINLQS